MPTWQALGQEFDPQYQKKKKKKKTSQVMLDPATKLDNSCGSFQENFYGTRVLSEGSGLQDWAASGKCSKYRVPRPHTMGPKPFHTGNGNLEGSQLYLGLPEHDANGEKIGTPCRRMEELG